jgi:hypothetical protein
LYAEKQMQRGRACWMTPSQLTRRDALVGTIAAPFLAGRAAGAAEPAGTVEALRGEATAQATSGVRPLAQDASVLVGDLVATGAQSAIALRLGAATQVRLGPEARLRIDRFLIKAGGILELANGAMVFDHDPAAGPTEVAVRSPFGLIAVRGTRFFAGPSDGVFGVFVARGVVLVVGQNRSMRVEAEFGTDIAAHGMEPTPPHRWAVARIKPAMASVM